MSRMRPGPLGYRPTDNLSRRRFRPRPEVLEDRRLLATLPAGFTETLVATGLSRPTAMEFAPDGRLFVTQQGGQLRVIRDGQLLATPFVSLNVDSNGERGLLGVTFDPQFATNQFVYVYYTVPGAPAHNRISRFTAVGDVAVAGSEVQIFNLDNLSGATNHNGGAIHFGTDGKLYAGVGENATPSHAQTLNNVLGKVLRINADGSIPADNPFFGTATGNNRAIWTLGLRNPFTFAVQPGTGTIFINDVGQNTWEEINVGAAGANFGWPATEGPTTDPRFVGPLSSYRQGTGDGACAISGGTFYNPATVQFPADQVGDYFFADLCAGWIHRLDVASGAVSDFADGISSPVDLKVAADGSLYYLAGAGSNAGAVFRIQGPVTGQAPAVTGQPADQSTLAGQAVTFAVTASGTAPLAYQWQRDGANIAGATGPSFTIAAVAAGDFGARFRVVVSNAIGSATSNEALLSQAPTGQAPAVTGQPADQFALEGEGVTFTAVASGAEPLAYQWQRNGVNIAGATGPSYAIATVSAGDIGARFRVVVSNASGFVSSREALLVGPSSYVQSLYGDILFRSADRFGLSSFSLQLAQGVPAEQIATQILFSIERLELEVIRTYQAFLGRIPARPEIDGWLAFLNTGRSETDLETAVLSSPEYFARQGNTIPGFIRGLYRDNLAREASPAEVNGWESVNLQVGRFGVALGIRTSVEAYDRVVAALYLGHLRRPSRADERASWVAQLRTGLTRERLELIIFLSLEYRSRFPS